jgi:hypothetical protein
MQYMRVPLAVLSVFFSLKALQAATVVLPEDALIVPGTSPLDSDGLPVRSFYLFKTFIWVPRSIIGVSKMTVALMPWMTLHKR